MILHRDRYFEHLYDVKLDLVTVTWPDIENIYLPEIFHSVNVLVENVKNYNIRNLLVDARETKLLASYEDADRVVKAFTHGLAQSRLQKLARIESVNYQREISLKQLTTEMNATFSYKTMFFKDTKSAMDWLQGKENLNSFTSY
jgi:hypothetical protein